MESEIKRNFEMDLDYIAARKAELKKQIDFQGKFIASSYSRILSPAGIASMAFKIFDHKKNLIDGILYGVRVFGELRSQFKNRRESRF